MRYGNRIRLPGGAYANPDHLFHIVVRTHPEIGKLPPAVREAVWASLVAETERERATLFAAVLMPDHVHAIVGAGEWDVVRWVGAWKSIATRAAWSAGHVGTVWQRRFYDRAIRGERELDVVLDYVLRNPENAGLVVDGETWPHTWSRFGARADRDREE